MQGSFSRLVRRVELFIFGLLELGEKGGFGISLGQLCIR